MGSRIFGYFTEHNQHSYIQKMLRDKVTFFCSSCVETVILMVEPVWLVVNVHYDISHILGVKSITFEGKIEFLCLENL